MNKAELLEEQKRWEMKYFDLAETQVKLWISRFLEDSADVVFPDFKDDTDVLSIYEDGKYYTFYLSENKVFEVKELTENMRKAMSVLYDSVIRVYGPIVHTAMIGVLQNVMPTFDNENYRFKFVAVNKLAVIKQNLLNKLYESQEYNKKLDEFDNDEVKEIRVKLDAFRDETIKELNSITEEDINADEKNRNEVESRLTNGPYLYICAREGGHNESTIAKRLPVVGPLYCDPEEETLENLIQEI